MVDFCTQNKQYPTIVYSDQVLRREAKKVIHQLHFLSKDLQLHITEFRPVITCEWVNCMRSAAFCVGCQKITRLTHTEAPKVDYRYNKQHQQFLSANCENCLYIFVNQCCLLDGAVNLYLSVKVTYVNFFAINANTRGVKSQNMVVWTKTLWATI